MGAAADRLWTCGQRKRVAHRVHSSQQQTQKIATAGGDIFDPDGDDVTATQVAVNCQIEHGKVARAAFNLEFRPD
jgi:hypothetical protein